MNRFARALLGTCAALLVFAAMRPAHAALVAQMGRCTPPAEEAVADKVVGFGNTPATRTFFVNFAWSVSSAASAPAAEIAATHRVEVCGVDGTGAFNCPGWDAGGNAWVIFDDSRGIGSKPGASIVKTDPAGDAKDNQIQRQDLPVDWDSVGSAGQILFFVVNAASKPASLAAVAGSIRAGGFCGVVSRLGAGGIGVPAAASDPGTVTANNIQFVSYGVPTNVSSPPGWTFGSVCSAGPPAPPNTARYGNYGASPCVDRSAAIFGLDRLAGVDDWQFTIAQGGLQAFGAQKHTWHNGAGGPGGTCAPGATCPTRALFVPLPSSEGYGYGGMFSETDGNFLVPVDPFDGNASAIVRGHAHEYFHGLQETWHRESGSDLYSDIDFLEPGATTAEPSTCLTNYPGNGATTLPATRCISARTLYYTYGGLSAGNDFLQFPENPLEFYPGVLFYRYVAAQFAYPQNGTKPQLAHLSTAPQQVDSVSPVLYQAPPNSTVENPLVSRRPDEGLDLMGFVLAALDTSGATQTPCNASLPAGASVDQRVSCVLSQYIGRSFEDELLEFHTMMVLKDYVDTDERWRLAWLGDYNDGAAAPIYPGAPKPVGIKGQKPFVQATSTGGAGFPTTPTTNTPDGLVRVKRVQDTYTCSDATNCSGANLTVNTLAAGQTLSSPTSVSIGKWGSAYVSIHPDPTYGTLGVRVKVEKGTPRFRVFTIDTSGVPTLVPACAAGPSASEVCPVNAQDGTMSVDVPIQATTDEVLIVASASDESAFSWRFGPDQARLRIASPTTAAPAIIGGFDTGTLKTKPFVLYFTATDLNDAPIDTVGSSDLVVKVGGTPCTFTLTGFSGGSYMAVVTVPASVYPATAPAAATKFDLAISLASGAAQPDTALQALIVTPDLEHVATELVIDVSGSMGSDSKLDNTKKAAHLVLDGLSDDDYAGLSVFSTNSLDVKALTQLSVANARSDLSAAIDSLTAAGSTAIGNGLFRGQDALATAFDGATASLTDGIKRGMILLSDGKSNCPWTPLDYVYFDQSGDHALATCANCECNIDTVPTVAPWPADQSTAPYAKSPLGYFARRGAGSTACSGGPCLLPAISVIGIEPDPDMGTLGQLATLTGGAQFKDPSTDPIELALEITDGFRTAMSAFSGYERSLASELPNLGALPGFNVDAGTDSMLISIVSFVDPADAVLLVTPGGVELTPERAAPERAVFRVRSPQAGHWGFHLTRTGTTSSSSANTAFVEVAVRSSCHLLVRTELKNARVPRTPPTVPPALGAPVEDHRWTGDEVVLEAVVHDGRPISGSNVLAAVEAPDGTATPVLLYDDGHHGDGRANDGLYGARYLNTAQSGAYRVRYFSSTPPSSGKTCAREKRDVIALHNAPDADANSLPDWWQDKYRIVTGTEFDDPDRDGLPTALEFLSHTRPDSSDTDGGGESDSSELSAGRNPNDPSDDATGLPRLVALPGNGHVLLALGMPVQSGATLEVQSGPTRDGAFSPDQTFTSNQGPVIVMNATNGVQRCYTARVSSSGVTSAWSSPACATPNADPVPPQIRSIRLENGAVCARSRNVNITINASDSQVDSRRASELSIYRDSAVAISGISDMQVTTSVSHTSPVWVPFKKTAAIDFGDATKVGVTVRLRDAAGNETPDQLLTFVRCDGSGIDRAIVLEERAIDRFNANDCKGARTLLQQSIPEINASIAALAAIRKTASLSNKVLIDNLTLKLKHVLSEKNEAVQFACTQPFSFRAHEVQEALDEESDVDATAVGHGFQL